MKKLLLSSAIVFGAIFGTNAQTAILFQDFQSTQTSTPSGWTQQRSATDGGWEFNNHYGTSMGQNVPTHTYCAFVDDWDNNSNHLADFDTLYTPVINCSSSAHVFVSMDYLFWADDGNESATVLISSDGGTTWTSLGGLSNTGANWTDSIVVDISTYAAGQANVKLAYTYYNGYPVNLTNGYTSVGMGIDNVDVFTPLNYDLSVTSQNTAPILQVNSGYTFSGTIYNYGGATITSMNMNYTVNGGGEQTETISGITGFTALSSYNWVMNTIPFTPAVAGTYTVKCWADNINGSNVDQNNANDTLTTVFWAPGTLEPRQALYEEFTGQSCVWCMLSAPNMDSVANNNAATSNIIRYHVPIPGRDFMYNETSGNVNSRMTYYDVQGAPTGFLDGATVAASPVLFNGNPPASYYYSSTTLQADNALGSPFTIDITSSGYNAARDSFYVTANIKAYADFAAGLRVQTALTLDSITYPQDLSSDDPPQEFPYPIGDGDQNFSDPGVTLYYYPYVLKFTHVLEDMLPSGNGASLSAFTSGQTQTVSFGWKQNHSFGQYPEGNNHGLGDSTKYHASSTGQFVVFVQSNTAVANEGIPAQYIYQSASTPVTGINDYIPITSGTQQISAGVSFEMYPNPTDNNTNLVFKLDNDQNVSISVYNMLGEQVYSLEEGTLSEGNHTIMLNSSGLQSGVYIVKINTDNTTTIKKLVIQH